MNEWKAGCPMCGHTGADESAAVDQELVFVSKQCADCSAIWLDVYEFSHVELDEGIDDNPLFI